MGVLQDRQRARDGVPTSQVRENFPRRAEHQFSRGQAICLFRVGVRSTVATLQ